MPNSKRPKQAAIVTDWSDKAQVLQAVSRDGLLLRNASVDCCGDPEIVLMAVKRNGLALEFASPALRNNGEVALVAVRQTGQALRFVLQEPRCDKDVVLEAVSRHGIALSMASEALQGDRDVVLRAVSQQGSALRYATAELRADRIVVMAAVQQAAIALRYAKAEVLENDGFLEEVQPFLEQLYLFKATLLSGRSCLAVLRPYQTKQEILRVVMVEFWLSSSTLSHGEVFLGSDPMPEGALEQISCLALGELYEVQIVLKDPSAADCGCT
mmetsp:Transcript_53802/g.128175  ORF Transcript_53802/g.128175 Transcript_53802/m.128175 type:complete len:270 (-) Transcript_53802:39-848(-)